MLVLTRKLKEQIRVGKEITITILRVSGKSVRVGIEAPRNVRVVRAELPDLEDAPGEVDDTTVTHVRVSRNTNRLVRKSRVETDAEMEQATSPSRHAKSNVNEAVDVLFERSCGDRRPLATGSFSQFDAGTSTTVRRSDGPAPLAERGILGRRR